MRYRHALQAFSSWRDLGDPRDEGTTIRRDAVDGVEQLAHRRDERDLALLAVGDEALVVGAQPRILPHGGEQRHPERAAQSRVAEGHRAAGLALARMVEARDRADEGRELLGTAEALELADFGDEASSGLRADPIDGGQQRADLVIAQRGLDATLELAQTTASDVDVFARVAHLNAVCVAVVTADRSLRSVDELACKFRTDLVPAVVDELRERTRHDGERGSSRVLVQHCRGELAVE